MTNIIKQVIKTIILIETCVINKRVMYINRHHIIILLLIVYNTDPIENNILRHFTVTLKKDMYIMA